MAKIPLHKSVLVGEISKQSIVIVSKILFRYGLILVLLLRSGAQNSLLVGNSFNLVHISYIVHYNCT